MSQAFPMFLHFVAGIFGALGQYYYKRGGARLGTTPLFENWQIAVGILCFCAVMLLFVFSYKAGGRISAVYPFYATTFLWGALLGKFLDGEPLNATIIAGTLIILLGVTIVGLGARV
jgi:drug/metabolite transporter (DMT)-like permease